MTYTTSITNTADKGIDAVNDTTTTDTTDDTPVSAVPAGTVKLTTYLEHDIFVHCESGEFVTLLPGRGPVKRADLADLKKEIDKLGSSAIIMEVTLPEVRAYRGFPPMTHVRKTEATEMKTSTKRYNTSSHRYYPKYQEHEGPFVEAVRDVDGEWEHFRPNDNLYVYDPEVSKAIDAATTSYVTAWQALRDEQIAVETSLIESHKGTVQGILDRATPLTRATFNAAKDGKKDGAS